MNALAIQEPQDWHPEDIKAALRKRGFTFGRIAREHGYREDSPKAVLRRRWRQVERIVADILGVPPEEIWPSRYGSQPRRNRRSRGERRTLRDRRAPV